MGKKVDRKADGESKKKSGKKRKDFGAPIEDALACPPSTRFFCELVVGNGLGDNAVDDALEAYRRAFESRRERALEAARRHDAECGKGCRSEEHMVVGPYMSTQDWRIEEGELTRATTWSWLGYQSIHFCRRN